MEGCLVELTIGYGRENSGVMASRSGTTFVGGAIVGFRAQSRRERSLGRGRAGYAGASVCVFAGTSVCVCGCVIESERGCVCMRVRMSAMCN